MSDGDAVHQRLFDVRGARVVVTGAASGLGFAIAEFDYVHPFNRPGRGWVWQFNVSPGF